MHRDTLIDELWEDREAKDPVNALQVQVTKLRAALATRDRGGRLRSRHGGYQFVLGPEDQLDTARFEAAAREGVSTWRQGRTGRRKAFFGRGLRCGGAARWTICWAGSSTPSGCASRNCA